MSALVDRLRDAAHALAGTGVSHLLIEAAHALETTPPAAPWIPSSPEPLAELLHLAAEDIVRLHQLAHTALVAAPGPVRRGFGGPGSPGFGERQRAAQPIGPLPHVDTVGPMTNRGAR